MIECSELHAENFGVDPLGWLPLLCASPDVSTGSGAVISANVFILGTIFKMQGSAQGFPVRFLFGTKKTNL